MYCILNIGMTGQGKTKIFTMPYINKNNRNCLVFDVQNEYNFLSTDTNQPRSRVIDNNVKRFFNLVQNKRNTICVFEEATIFFEGRMDKDLRLTVVGKRHTGNIYIFNFHSFEVIPPRLLLLTNFIVLFKTLDTVEQVREKVPRYLHYWERVMKMPQHSFVSFKTIEQ